MKTLPNATAVLVLGILSIVFICCCYGLFAIILAVVALILAAQDKKKYLADPDAYSKSSYSNLNAGRVCALIGLILGAIYMISMLIMFIVGFSQGGFFEFQRVIEEIVYELDNI